MARWEGRERRNDSGDRLILEVPQGSNLDKVVRLFIATLGSGLQAIALALSTPQDNSAEVQKQINELTAQINASAAEMKDAVDQQTKEN